jgi:hypothetical protein
MYNLNNNWTCWIHYQNDNLWTLDRYQKITTLATLKDAVLFIENLDENIIKKTMLFFMKDSILPLWESEDNINGGCFSYKISNINIVNIFKILLYKIIGNTLINNENTLMNASTEIIVVNTKKLETIFDEHHITHVHYLSIDVEGGEVPLNRKAFSKALQAALEAVEEMTKS